MQYLYFPQQNLSEYDLNGGLLSHSKISQNNRARLYAWLSEECCKQSISRYSFVLTCSYLDLYFMKKNDVQLKNYQLLALGALILATKQVQIQMKVPVIDIKLFNPEQLLAMEKKIIYALDFYLNPPSYIELLNNIAKMWDMKCQSGEIKSNVRYFKAKKESYIRLKRIYEKMDCLNLFKRILDFGIEELVVTLFYRETKHLDSELKECDSKALSSMKEASQNPEEQEQFELKFQEFLFKSQINTKVNPLIEKAVLLLTKENYQINDEIPKIGKTFTQLLSYQTCNRNGLMFYQMFQAQITKL